MTVVSLVRCDTYEEEKLEAGVRRAVDLLGGMTRFVRPGDRVLLKANLLCSRAPEKRVTTDPGVVRAVARMVLEAGARPFIGDSPSLGSFRRIAEKSGMAAVAEQLGIEVVELSDPVPVSPPEGSLFRKLEISSQALNADRIINLPKLKTHSQMLLTLGVKNLFGTVVAQRKAEWHYTAGVDRDTFASLLLDIYRTVQPGITILDGIWAMEGRGPSNGRPRKLNLIAAAEDAVALDTLVCRILGVPPRSFPLYRVARRRGIGATDEEALILRGDPPDAFRVPGFSVPSLDSLGVMPGLFGWFTKRFLVSKPVHMGDACTGCGQCAGICPAKALTLTGQGILFDYGRCIRCYCCQEVCPEDAIRFKQGLLVRLLNRFNR
ncbi:MAG: DUF362 domain-containing protein [Deltaproteobacteria bacterium]|nr:DUF362 domain-containing protein [Deltaproteobacteria bacterium]